tara:strand:+ start:1077 stop:1916 length:840 start_codon:yes stop_codon:yes gene_type:complete
MKNILKLTLIVLQLFLVSCANKDKKIITLDNTNLESQMIEAYKLGMEALEDGDVLFAAKNFNIAENLYPQSPWARKSAIMAAYAYYKQDYYGDAIYELSRFIKTYPNSEYIQYAHYLMALCYYETIVDEKKDLNPLLNSKKTFEYIVKNYPETDFSLDAKYKIMLINNILASKELHIAKYYLNKGKWIPAINRFKTILNEYGETIYIEEAIHRLVEVYYKIGFEDESKKYAKLLGYNYLSSKWYEESYKIFNKKYLNSREKIKKDKKNIIIRNFQKLFE